MSKPKEIGPEIITSKGKGKRYLCDICEKLFVKDDMEELAYRPLKWKNSPIMFMSWLERKYACFYCRIKIRAVIQRGKSHPEEWNSLW